MKAGKIGRTHSYIASARELIDSMTILLKEKPVLNLCDKFWCIWCRELERRMNLFTEIENPRFFQKNKVILRILALGNGIRLRRFNLLMLRDGKGEFSRNIKLFRSHVALYFLNDLYLTFRMKLHLTE